jgi:hypothetical protein
MLKCTLKENHGSARAILIWFRTGTGRTQNPENGNESSDSIKCGKYD